MIFTSGCCDKPSAKINKEFNTPAMLVEEKCKKITLHLTERQKQIIWCLISERVAELKHSKTRDEDKYLELIKLLVILE